MKMTKKYRHICAILGLSLICGTGMVSATSGSRMVSATYRDIKVTLNGVPQAVTNEQGATVEPFAVAGTTYVPLRAVSNILGAGVTWDPATSTVQLTGGSSSTTTTTDVSAYLTKINDLQNQLNAANAELAKYKGSSTTTPTTPNGKIEINSATLTETAKYLYDNYSTELHKDIDLDFDLTQKASRLQLNITYTSSSENSKYDNNLTQSRVKKFVESVCDEVATRYGDVQIQGDIIYDKSSPVTKVSFTRSTSGSYKYDFGMSEASIKQIVENETGSYISFGSMGSIYVQNINTTLRNNRITFEIRLNATQANMTSDQQEKNWNNVIGQVSNDLRNMLQDIQHNIENESDDDYSISGTIVTSDGRTIAEIDQSGSVRTNQF